MSSCLLSIKSNDSWDDKIKTNISLTNFNIYYDGSIGPVKRWGGVSGGRDPFELMGDFGCAIKYVDSAPVTSSIALTTVTAINKMHSNYSSMDSIIKVLCRSASLF
jgi:hypothetical protein